MAKKKGSFGGYQINFAGQTATVEDVMGSAPIGPQDMMKKLWTYVKSKKLSSKGK